MKQIEALSIAEKLDLEWKNDALNYDTAILAAAELRRLLSEALRIEALHAQAKRELFDARQLNKEMLDALKNLLAEGEFTDYPNTTQWKAVEAAKVAISKAKQ